MSGRRATKPVRPLVSVLTPCYNHAVYLPEYFESLLQQTYPAIELVFRDDCSSDDSWRVFRDWEPRLRAGLSAVVADRAESNLGLLRSMQSLLNQASGAYISLLESDDYFYPHKTETQIAFLEANPEIGAVHTDVDFLYPDGKLEKNHWGRRYDTMPTGWILEDLLRENHILTCTFCCRADELRKAARFEEYAARGYRTADYPLFLDLSAKVRFGYIPTATACYRVVDSSISHPSDLNDLVAWKLSYYRVKIDVLESTERDVAPATRRRALRQWWKIRFVQAYLSRNPAKAREALKQLSRLGDRSMRGPAARARVLATRLPRQLHESLTARDPMLRALARRGAARETLD